MMVSQSSFDVRAVIRKAASRLSGFKRRLFVAEMAIEDCQASPRRTESILGFNRRAVARGLQELELGTQHDLEKGPSHSAPLGRYLSTRRQADQRRIRVYLRAFTEIAGTW